MWHVVTENKFGKGVLIRLIEFQNKTKIEIIGFQLMHFWFAFDSWNVDLGDIDLLDTDLDLLVGHG